jgi:hypothetical protein
MMAPPPVIASLIDNRKRVNKKAHRKLRGPDIPIEDLKRFASVRTPQRFQIARQNRLKTLEEHGAATIEPGSASRPHPVEDGLSDEKPSSWPPIVEKLLRGDQQDEIRDTHESQEEHTVEEAFRSVSQRPQVLVHAELENKPSSIRYAGNIHFIIEEENEKSDSAESNKSRQQ